MYLISVDGGARNVRANGLARAAKLEITDRSFPFPFFNGLEEKCALTGISLTTGVI
jgi:hypothetical protein